MSSRFEVVHGQPDDEELAVVVSLLTAMSAAATVAAPSPEQTANWARPVLRKPVDSGAGAWWRSGLPQP